MSNILKFVIFIFQYWHFLNNKQVFCDLLSVPRGVEAHLSLQKRYKAHNTHKSLSSCIFRDKTDSFWSRIYKFVQNQHFLSVPLRFSLLVIAVKGAQLFLFFFLHIFWTQKGLTDFCMFVLFFWCKPELAIQIFYMWWLDSDTWIYLDIFGAKYMHIRIYSAVQSIRNAHTPNGSKWTASNVNSSS